MRSHGRAATIDRGSRHAAPATVPGKTAADLPDERLGGFGYQAWQVSPFDAKYHVLDDSRRGRIVDPRQGWSLESGVCRL